MSGIGGLGGASGRSVDRVPGDGGEIGSERPAPVRAPGFGRPSPADVFFAETFAAVFVNKGILRAKIEDYRSPAAAKAAVTTPLATPEGARPFGKTTVFRGGIANTHASPAFLFRLARYTDRLLIAYPNAKEGQDLTPRPATEIDGIPVPPELRGKIFVSGDPSPRMIAWPEASDLFLKQLEAADGSEFLKGGGIDGAGLTVLGYSQGGIDAAETRRRLEAAGKPNVIGKVVALSAPMRGTPKSDEPFLGIVAKGLALVSRGRTPAAIRAVDPDAMARAFSDRDQRLVDLAISNSVDGPGAENVRPLLKEISREIRLHPLSRWRGPNDGWVHTASMEFGRDVLRLERAYDHPGMVEDPRIIDDIARRLAAPPVSPPNRP